jgi:hypothetical protein
LDSVDDRISKRLGKVKSGVVAGSATALHKKRRPKRRNASSGSLKACSRGRTRMALR